MPPSIVGAFGVNVASSSSRFLVVGAMAALAVATPRTAAAQSADAGVSAERFQPAPGPRNFVTVETARVAADPSYSFGILVDWAHDPFRLRHCLPASCDDPGAEVRRVEVVKDLATANLLASVTPISRLQIGLRVPIAYASGQGLDDDPSSAGYGQEVAGGVSGVALGDPALELKLRVLGGVKSPLAAGVSGSISAPLGHATAPALYVGDQTAVGTLRAIVDADLGQVFFAANLGGAFRGKTQVGSLDLGSELRGGVGAGLRLTRVVELLAEGFASTNFTTSSGSNAAEVDLSARFLPRSLPLVFTMGGGAGLNEGVGAPSFRALAGVSFVMERAGKQGEVDPDRDGDGIRNEDDRCPDEGGDVVRMPGRFYGCPVRDTDKDGIADHLDACPTIAGVATQDPKTNGCPNNDRDGDGIPNDVDKCPDAPETYNGFQDKDGCPDVAPIVVEVKSNQIVVNEKINFEFDSAKIVGARSFEALDAVAQVIVAHPEIRRIEVAGHTDDVGPRDANLKLSASRADAVIAYLAKKGVATSRLESRGYGPDQPIAPNTTEDGRAQNRRVQFNILVMSK